MGTDASSLTAEDSGSSDSLCTVSCLWQGHSRLRLGRCGLRHPETVSRFVH